MPVTFTAHPDIFTSRVGGWLGAVILELGVFQRIYMEDVARRTERDV